MYKFLLVANQRGEGQTLIAFPLDERFLAAVDRARGGKSRSAFVREALLGYMNDVHQMGLPKSIIEAPDRAGKGGRAAKVPASPILNDAPHPSAPKSKGPVRYDAKPPKKKAKRGGVHGSNGSKPDNG